MDYISVSSQQFSPVGTVVVQSPSGVMNNEPYKVHYWTDHIHTTAEQGHLSDINARLRQEHAVWEDGGALSFLDNAGASLSEDTGVTEAYNLDLHTQKAPQTDSNKKYEFLAIMDAGSYVHTVALPKFPDYVAFLNLVSPGLKNISELIK